VGGLQGLIEVPPIDASALAEAYSTARRRLPNAGGTPPNSARWATSATRVTARSRPSRSTRTRATTPDSTVATPIATTGTPLRAGQQVHPDRDRASGTHERGRQNRWADQQPQQLRVAATDQVQPNDHHDQRQRQPHPEVALHHRPDQLGAAHRAKQPHPALVGLPSWIVPTLVHHLAPDVPRLPG
jgi:hypothetical protein